MPTFIKTGFWEKQVKGFNGWLNLDDLIRSLSGGSSNSSMVGFPAVQRENLLIEDTTLESVEFSVGGGSFLTVYSKTISFPNLVSVTEYLRLDNLGSATLVNLPNLETVGNDLTINSNAPTLTLNIEKIVSAPDFTINSNVSVLNIPNYTTGSLSINSDTITSINAPNFANGYISINNDNQTTLTTVSFPALSVCAGIYIDSCLGLTTVNLPALTSVAAEAEIYLTNNALTETNVNTLLAKFVEIGVSGIVVDLSGGTNAAPTGQGITDVATLISNGCTVTTN